MGIVWERASLVADLCLFFCSGWCASQHLFFADVCQTAFRSAQFQSIAVSRYSRLIRHSSHALERMALRQNWRTQMAHSYSVSVCGCRLRATADCQLYLPAGHALAHSRRRDHVLLLPCLLVYAYGSPERNGGCRIFWID